MRHPAAALAILLLALASLPGFSQGRGDQRPPRRDRPPRRLDNLPSRFVDNRDGTVTDPSTGLRWQQTDGGEMTWENARRYCPNLSLGGSQGWRLPSTVELFGLMDQSLPKPAMNTRVFLPTEAEYWWTFEARLDDPSRVWVVNSGGGAGPHPLRETLSAGGDRRFHTRCVEGPPTPKADLLDNGDGTIADRRTGLVWQKGESPAPLTWEEAKRYAAGLRLAQQTDWRLPDIKELQSLNDPKTVRPSISKALFPDAAAEEYWSSTSMNRPNYAWTVNFNVGIVSYSEMATALRVRAVRGRGASEK